MSLADAYTLGVRLTGDITSLRQELAAGTALVSQFSKASVDAMNRAAAAIEASATSLQSSTNRTTRSNKTKADSFEQYMRRVEAAEKHAAKASRESADEVQRSAGRTNTALSGVAASLGRLAGFGGLAVLAKQTWDLGLGFHEFQQNSTLALTTLLGGAEKARTFLADVLAFAQRTPYAFTDLTDQAQKLLAMGFDSERVIPILTAVGDAATGMGKGTEGVDRLARALGQINAKGRLQSEELLQMNEIGVNGLAILANQAGMTTIEFQDMVTKGLIPADQAVEGLVRGINEGTNGINGQTAAFGGLMEQIKGSGGITATLDSAKSGFRNAAAAVTDSLVPAFIDFLQLATQGLGVVRSTANLFNDLPGPVQSSALAFAAATVAVRLLNVQGRASSVWSGFSTVMAASRANVEALGRSATSASGRLLTARLAVSSFAGAARGIGPALLGAFGGPVGLAITGVTVAITALASANAAARARVEEVADTLNVQTGALTENSDAWIRNELAKEQSFGIAGIGNMRSMVDMADMLGVSVETLTAAYQGNTSAIRTAKEAADAYEASSPFSPTVEAAAIRFRRNLDDQAKRLKEARDLVDAKNRVDKVQNDNLDEGARRTETYTNSIRDWSDEQQKAIGQAEEAARKAAGLNLGSVSLDLSTEDDLVAAREKVADATRKVRDEEADREDTYARKKVSANDKVKADEAVADARKALADATAELGNVEARRDPVAQFKKRAQEIIESTRTFKADIDALTQRGLNATDLSALIAAGPEATADIRKALLGDPGMVDFTNEARDTIDALGTEIAAQARVAQSALEAPGKMLGSNLLLGMQIAAREQTATTIQALAEELGADPTRIYNVGKELGLSFMSGLADATSFKTTVTRTADGGYRTGPTGPAAYATGGVLPGYSPGVDNMRFYSPGFGRLDLSGGEAIMRPEFTRAVGPGFVDQMNRIARTAGVGGVREAMSRYLGGFANGGVLAPQVVTVPVESRHERYSPVTVQKAYVVNAASLGLYGDRARQQRNIFGGNRG